MIENENVESVVVSSRIRLARNLRDLPFPRKLKTSGQADVAIKSIFDALKDYDNFNFYRLKNYSEIDSLVLMEKHEISKELIENKEIAGYCINKSGDIIVMVNEEDHIRAQCVMHGLCLEKAYEKLSELDDHISQKLEIAFDEELGFLTSCPSNLGTGMRASVMMFLPALTMSGAISNIISTVAGIGLTVRGVYGEGSKAEGYMYQISNQSSLGFSEMQIIKNVTKAVEKIVEMETDAREILFETKKDDIKDMTLRAYGVLSNCYQISTDEFVKLLSQVKLGKILGFISLKDDNILTDIEISAQPANLMQRYGKEMSPKERDKFRADFITRSLKNQRI